MKNERALGADAPSKHHSSCTIYIETECSTEKSWEHLTSFWNRGLGQWIFFFYSKSSSLTASFYFLLASFHFFLKKNWPPSFLSDFSIKFLAFSRVLLLPFLIFRIWSMNSATFFNLLVLEYRCRYLYISPRDICMNPVIFIVQSKNQVWPEFFFSLVTTFGPIVITPTHSRDNQVYI